MDTKGGGLVGYEMFVVGRVTLGILIAHNPKYVYQCVQINCTLCSLC